MATINLMCYTCEHIKEIEVFGLSSEGFTLICPNCETVFRFEPFQEETKINVSGYLKKYSFAVILALGASYLHGGTDWFVIAFILAVIISAKWYYSPDESNTQARKRNRRMTQTYLEITDTRSGEAVITGIGAMFKTKEETIHQFELSRQYEDKEQPFLLDLYVDENLEDTIHLSVESVELISGTKVQSAEYYVKRQRLIYNNLSKNLKE